MEKRVRERKHVSKRQKERIQKWVQLSVFFKTIRIILSHRDLAVFKTIPHEREREREREREKEREREREKEKERREREKGSKVFVCCCCCCCYSIR